MSAIIIFTFVSNCPSRSTTSTIIKILFKKNKGRFKELTEPSQHELRHKTHSKSFYTFCKK